MVLLQLTQLYFSNLVDLTHVEWVDDGRFLTADVAGTIGEFFLNFLTLPEKEFVHTALDIRSFPINHPNHKVHIGLE